MIFPGRAKSSEISYFPLETEKTTFFAQNVIGKCQILNSRRRPSPTHSRGMHRSISLSLHRNSDERQYESVSISSLLSFAGLPSILNQK